MIIEHYSKYMMSQLAMCQIYVDYAIAGNWIPWLGAVHALHAFVDKIE